jgi:hypothetical protein
MWKEGHLPPQDWFGYVGLPILGYALLCAGAGLLWSYHVAGLSLVGASAIVFLVVGVRNSWDLVLWIDQIVAAEGDTTLWEASPRPLFSDLETRSLRVHQGPKSGVAALFGQWPGDESDDDFEGAVRDLS